MEGLNNRRCTPEERTAERAQLDTLDAVGCRRRVLAEGSGRTFPACWPDLGGAKDDPPSRPKQKELGSRFAA